VQRNAKNEEEEEYKNKINHFFIFINQFFTYLNLEGKYTFKNYNLQNFKIFGSDMKI
jgi:hypothetical protein